jgi:uncharacterized protein YifE (UPF0438 family)
MSLLENAQDFPFELACSETIFSEDELEFLEDYGGFLEALTKGEITPINDEQKHFIKLCQGSTMMQTDDDNVNIWLKYLARISIEKAPEHQRAQRQKDKMVTGWERDPTCGPA